MNALPPRATATTSARPASTKCRAGVGYVRESGHTRKLSRRTWSWSFSVGYQEMKRLAKESGCNIPALLTLHRKNDPFFVGSPAQVAQGEWFVDLWKRFGYATGVHLRRVHYRLASQESATK